LQDRRQKEVIEQGKRLKEKGERKKIKGKRQKEIRQKEEVMIPFLNIASCHP